MDQHPADGARSREDVRLILMRHAKSDYPIGVGDHERPLSERGRLDAQAAGRWLAERSGSLLGQHALVLVSSALRTQQTWQIAGATLKVHWRIEPRLYEASEPAYLDVLREGIAALREETAHAATLLVIGHNPATESAARHLVREADTDPYRAMMRRLPTSAIAVIDLPSGSLVAGQGLLREFVIPRGQGGSGAMV